MSAKDLWMRDLVTRLGLIFSFVVILILVILRKVSLVRQSYFKTFLLGFESECAELASAYKKILFAPLREIVSHDEKLRTLGRIRILEIGVKTGDNIQYYPNKSHYIGVDWNRKLGDYLINGDRSWQFRHVVFERMIIGDGSSLKKVPEASVDVVVTTRSLCSTWSVTETLDEIHRVLCPGGKYLFLEHLPDNQGSLICWIQRVLTKTRVWPLLFGGCRLNSNPIPELEKSRFKETKFESFVLKGYVSQPHHLLLSRHHVMGSATR